MSLCIVCKSEIPNNRRGDKERKYCSEICSNYRRYYLKKYEVDVNEVQG